MPITEEEFTNLKGQLDDLEKRFKELKEKPIIKEPDKFEDIPFDPLRKIGKLYANLPVYSSVPAHTGGEGEIVLHDNGTDTRKIYVYLGGTWYSVAIT